MKEKLAILSLETNSPQPSETEKMSNLPKINVTAMPVSHASPLPNGKIRAFDESGKWFDRPQTTEIVVRTITPELAKLIVDHYSKPNRKIRDRNVKRYTTAMECDLWQLTNPIHFDEEGFLRDGQHRMRAVVKSGKATPFLVQFGTTQEQLDTIDEGASRSSKDVAAVRGVNLRGSVISGLSYILEYAEIKRITPREHISIFEDRHTPAANWVCDRLKKAPYNSNVVAALFIRAFYSCQGNEDKLDRLESFINIYQGTAYPSNDNDTAAIAFKEHFLNIKRQRSSGPNRKKIQRNGAWCLERFFNETPTYQVRRGDPVKMFPLPEEKANDGKIVI